ncbi:unnamed protein product, partial [Rhizoctonia solani]
SVKTKSARSTYVGSTPDPPRRLRQHNGELTQGAYKTRRGRPWVMTMIVHGFPSKLAALQFEWAWQHPYKSRHLRVSQTKQGKEIYSQMFKRDSTANLLRTKILVARSMLPIPPYNTWPLHVKIFSEEAKRLWDEVQKIETNEALPDGFTLSVEFEGVDGKAAVPVSRRSNARSGPIDVKDTEFNSSHILKYQSILNKGAQTSCSVCSSEINVKHMDHLRVALCPQHSCTAVSHLECLAQAFLRDPLSPKGLLPRGGVCDACNQYTLWGDVIRGCYRRARGGLQQPTSDQESEDDGKEEAEDIRPGDDPSSHIENPQITGSPRKATKASTARVTVSRKNKPTPAPRATRRRVRIAKPVDSDVEDFAAEMDAIECDTEDSEHTRPLPKERTRSARRTQAPISTRARVAHDKPRNMDEIVRHVLANLPISIPSESYQARPAKSTKAKTRVDTIGKERPNKDANSKEKTRATLKTTAPKPRKRTPSPECIDFEGI